MNKKTFAERIFDAQMATGELNNLLEESGLEFENTKFDWYDRSLEILGVANGARMNEAIRNILINDDFNIVFFNHLDGWETHYGKSSDFRNGWRVSYKHRRNAITGQKDNYNILVEEKLEGWPQEWFDTGYVTVIKDKNV